MKLNQSWKTQDSKMLEAEEVILFLKIGKLENE